MQAELHEDVERIASLSRECVPITFKTGEVEVSAWVREADDIRQAVHEALHLAAHRRFQVLVGGELIEEGTFEDNGLGAGSKLTVQMNTEVEVIQVSGTDENGPDCNGLYKRSEKERNGRHCFSKINKDKWRKDRAIEYTNGAIYYKPKNEDDPKSAKKVPEMSGGYWKVCQAGRGEKENGWNFSQFYDGDAMDPPLGLWDPSLRIMSESSENYTNFQLELLE